MDSILRRKFLEVAEIVLENFSGRTSKSEGCYICLMTKEPKIVLVVEVGDCSSKESLKFCQEKALRVQEFDLISSWQNRDRDKGQYGGAIGAPACSLGLAIGHDMIISVSGFSELEDEAFALVVALALKWITEDDISRIASISDNSVVYRLIKACAELFE